MVEKSSRGGTGLVPRLADAGATRPGEKPVGGVSMVWAFPLNIRSRRRGS